MSVIRTAEIPKIGKIGAKIRASVSFKLMRSSTYGSNKTKTQSTFSETTVLQSRQSTRLLHFAFFRKL